MVIEYFYGTEIKPVEKQDKKIYIPFTENLNVLSPEIVARINDQIQSLYEKKLYSPKIWLETFQKTAEIPFVTTDDIDFVKNNVGHSYRLLYILEKRCVEKQSFRVIAENLGLSTQRVQQVYYNGIRKIAQNWVEYQTELLLEKEYKKVFQTISQDILQTPIDNLDIPKRMKTSLRYGKVKTVNDLLLKGHELFYLRSVGKDAVMELILYCREYVKVPFMEEFIRCLDEYKSPEKSGFHNYVMRKFVLEAHKFIR